MKLVEDRNLLILLELAYFIANINLLENESVIGEVINSASNFEVSIEKYESNLYR